jgi:hypothetical protein
MKDVKIRESADVQRRLANSADIYPQGRGACRFPPRVPRFYRQLVSSNTVTWARLVHPECAPCALGSHPPEHLRSGGVDSSRHHSDDNSPGPARSRPLHDCACRSDTPARL